MFIEKVFGHRLFGNARKPVQGRTGYDVGPVNSINTETITPGKSQCSGEAKNAEIVVQQL